MILSRFRRISWMITGYDPEMSWFPDMGWLRLPISLDFLGFESILIVFSWFSKDFHDFEMILLVDSWIWPVWELRWSDFLVFLDDPLIWVLRWPDSWIWHDLMALKTRFPGFWWFWTPGYWILMVSEAFWCLFWDDFPAFRMIMKRFRFLIALICLDFPLILAVSWIPDDFRTDFLDFTWFPVSRTFLRWFFWIF